MDVAIIGCGNYGALSTVGLTHRVKVLAAFRQTRGTKYPLITVAIHFHLIPLAQSHPWRTHYVDLNNQTTKLQTY